MNSDSTKYEAFTCDRVGQWRAKFIAQGAVVIPPPAPKKTLAEMVWPWLTVLAFVAIMGLLRD